MAIKKITSLDSIMFFTGLNADINAKALEDRKYNDYSDEIIGELNMTKDYDSVFSNTLSEIFVETTPKYKSIKDLTEIAFSYIINRSEQKQTSSDMFINTDGVINFEYNYENNLNSDLDNSKNVSMPDIKLFLSSLNNAMFNKQKYYSKIKEVHDLLNKGVEYKWMPTGSELNLYDEDKEEDYVLNVGNDYITYSLNTIQVQETKWDEATNSYINVTYTTVTGNEEIGYTYTENRKLINKFTLEYSNSYYDLIENRLSERYEEFKTTKENQDLLSYYIYDLNTNIPVVCYTYSFGKKPIDININYDGEFNNWFHNRISFNLNDKGNVSVVPGEDYWFNFSINENERIGEDRYLLKNSLSTFEIKENNNISLLSPYKLKKIDFSEVADKLVGEIDLLCNYNKKINYKDTINTNWLKEKGSLLEELIIGKEDVECQITSINGLEEFKNLKVLDLTGCINLSSNPDLSGLENIKDFNLVGTNVSVFAPARGAFINSAKLGYSIESIILNDITFKSEDSLQFNVSDKLSTLEINNVTNLDSYKLVRDWVNALEEANKLDGNKAGTINYINLTDVKWNMADYRILLKLSKIELDKFTGNIIVCGDDTVLYRKDYRRIIDAYGLENVNNPDSDLNLIVTVGENAFKVNIHVDEEFTNSRLVENEFGETVYENYIDTRSWGDLIITVEDTVTGNSFIDEIVDNPENFINLELSKFVNNNGYIVGYTYELANALTLPENTEEPEELHIGDILLYGKNRLVFVTNDIKNINQNFTKIGKFNNIEEFERYINYIFEAKNFLTFTSMEDEIFGPDEDNAIDVEYGLPEIKEENFIEVEYK